MKDIIQLYKETNNFEKAVKESGLPAFIGFLKLARAGLVSLEDKIKYGTPAQKLGGLAEQEFQKIIPEAINYNFLKVNNEFFDFKYNDVTIDVKFSSLHQRGKYEYWYFRANSTADLFVAFLEKEKGAKLQDYHILVLPQSFVENGYVNIKKGSYLFEGFNIERNKLKQFLDQYQESKYFL